MFGTPVPEIDAATLAQWREEGRKIRLVDVRSPAEFAQGIIANSILIPLHLLPLRAAELSDDVETVFYCRTGARSAQACMFMMQQGNQRVYNLAGGIFAWARAGRPIDSAETAAA